MPYWRPRAGLITAGYLYNMRRAQAKQYRLAGDTAGAERMWAVIHCAAALRRRGQY